MQLDLESNKAESVQGRTALALAHLHRIDPQANMARFFCGAKAQAQRLDARNFSTSATLRCGSSS